MLKQVCILILFLTSFNFLYAQANTQASYQLGEEIKSNLITSSLIEIPRFDSRRVTGLAYSMLVPGSGQIFLGHKTKGAAFAISFITGLVGAVVSQNNFIGNRERIETLQFEYLNADRFTLADYYWKQMVSVHEEQKTHERARNIFAAATVAIWAFNLVDYLFFTSDKGPIEFSSIQQNNSYSLISISIPLSW